MMNKSEDFFLKFSIKEINKLIRSKKIDEYDLIKETNLKTEKFDSKYFFWSSYDYKTLNDEVKRVKEQFKITDNLYSIPIGIKDIFNTKNYPTEMGSILWKNFQPGNDARVVYNIIEAGGIVAGKTVTAEFAVHDLNQTLNPYDIKLTPGTSSSGSAVSVAIGACPVSLATQTAGSIGRPASFNGIFGFKPSFGLIPRTGSLKTTDTLDSIGFFCSHLDNINIFFDTIRVKGNNYPFSNKIIEDKAKQQIKNNQKIKIAIVQNPTWKFVSDYAKETFEKFINKISIINNFELKKIDFNDDFEDIHNLHGIIYNKTLSYYFKNEYKNKELISKKMNKMIEDGLSINNNLYYQSIMKQQKLINKINNKFKEIDFIFSLSTSSEAPKRGDEEKKDNSLIYNFLHLPVAYVPLFKSPKGNPYGLQIASKKYHDKKLINFLNIMYKHNLIPNKINKIN